MSLAAHVHEQSASQPVVPFFDTSGSLHTFPRSGSSMSQAFQDEVICIKLRVYVCACSFVKVGAMVFLCHDINDIFMEGAKMARYADHGWLPTALFAVFMLSWFASRIYYFPVYVIRSVYYEPIEVRCWSPRATLKLLRCLSSVLSACGLPPQLLRRGCRSSIKLHCCRCQRLGPDLPPACLLAAEG